MASAATPEITDTTFSVFVSGIAAGEQVRFWLYYDNPRVAICDGQGDYWFGPSKTAGGHTFSASKLTPNTALVYTIRLLPVGKTNWETESTFVSNCNQKKAKTDPSKPAKVWPGNWTKWANLKQGDSVSLVTADDWNDFLDHINEVIDYKGGTKFNFAGYKKLKGDEMKANDFNAGAATAMKSIGLSPPSATAKSTITAQFFIDYEDALNSAK